MKKLKVGIVGCGFIANHRHIPAFLKLKNNVELRAMCDINEALANSVAKKCGVSNHYSSLRSMLKNEDLDIIDICTPPSIHMQVAVEATEFGCHVLMEKPMALKVSDCDLMIKAAINQVRSRSADLTIVKELLDWELKYNLRDTMKELYPWVESEIKLR